MKSIEKRLLDLGCGSAIECMPHNQEVMDFKSLQELGLISLSFSFYTSQWCYLRGDVTLLVFPLVYMLC